MNRRTLLRYFSAAFAAAAACVGIPSGFFALEGCNPGWLTTILGIIAQFLPAVGNVILLVESLGSGGKLTAQQVAQVNAILQKAQVAITTLKQLASDYAAAAAAAKGGILTQIQAIVATTRADLANIFSAVGIADPSTQTEIGNFVALFLITINSIVAALPGGQPVSMPPAVTLRARAAGIPSQIKDGTQFKADFNDLMQRANPSLVLK